jgi:hypothetical protein
LIQIVEAPRRPELAREVDSQMLAALGILTDLLDRGHAQGTFHAPDPRPGHRGTRSGPDRLDQPLSEN